MKMNQWFAGLVLFVGLVTHASGAGEPAIVKEDNVNVRGQASLAGEVITQVKKGERVVILEEIPVADPAKGEPKVWAKIQMPENTPVWIHTQFVDSQTKTVTASRLNLRAGPGENFSVVGRIERGDPVKEVRTVENWMEIEAPAGTYAFVARHLLDTQVPATPAAVVPPQAVPARSTPRIAVPAAVPVTPTVEKTLPAEPSPVPPVDELPRAVIPAAPAVVLPEAPVPPAEVQVEPALEKLPELEQETGLPPRRVVRREGIVKGTVSIQAPTYFELVGPDSKRVINYLHLRPEMLEKLQTDLQGFKDYVGRSVVVTGEEAVDPRWPKTPVIAVETLKLVL